MIMDRSFFLNNIEKIKKICIQAGLAQTNFQDKVLEIQSKSDNTPLTEVDIISHDIIVAGLKELDGTLPIVSEEGFQENIVFNNFWIVRNYYCASFRFGNRILEYIIFF